MSFHELFFPKTSSRVSLKNCIAYLTLAPANLNETTLGIGQNLLNPLLLKFYQRDQARRFVEKLLSNPKVDVQTLKLLEQLMACNGRFKADDPLFNNLNTGPKTPKQRIAAILGKAIPREADKILERYQLLERHMNILQEPLVHDFQSYIADASKRHIITIRRLNK